MTNPRSPEEILKAGEIPTLEGLEAWRRYKDEGKRKADKEARVQRELNDIVRELVADGMGEQAARSVASEVRAERIVEAAKKKQLVAGVDYSSAKSVF